MKAIEDAKELERIMRKDTPASADVIAAVISELQRSYAEVARWTTAFNELEAGSGKLPYDVIVGGNTFRKGVSFAAFVLAAQNWHREAYPQSYNLTQEQKDENFARLITPGGGAPGDPCGILASNISALYEELRQAIDGGSESMTHEDAVKAVKYWQDEIYELRLDAERYRWLRDPTQPVGLVLDKVVGGTPADESTGTGGYRNYEYRAGDDLDAAIDTAMKEKP